MTYRASILLFLGSVLIASISQIILKSSATTHHESIVKEYLNKNVIFAYILFFSSSLLTILAYQKVPLSLGPILEGTSYIYIAILGYLILKEKLNKKQILGLSFIVLGIVICYLPL